MRKLAFAILACILSSVVKAEDGSQLWLRMEANHKPVIIKSVTKNPSAKIAVAELQQYWHGAPVTLSLSPAAGGVAESYTISNGETVEITAPDAAGLLYGAYDLLRQQQMGTLKSGSSLTEKPQYSFRMLNHWDNLDGSIERGYAGKSLWVWEQIDGKKGKMSAQVEQRVHQYCRANASIGINATVLNNVNASPKILTTEYLKKVKVLADYMRAYNIKVYLSVNFATPMALKDTETADPLDEKVALWWKKKAAEIYKLIPDFGGFLVKANSEGQPGPGDYKRTHAEGANMLAAAVKPFGGRIIWRSFVYGNHKGEDRVMQAVTEFMPSEGRFADNVILQSKNGPLDFQPREPYAPIFDQIKQTPLMAELQITQEYLGQSLHLVYLATMWKEFFGYVSPQRLQGVAGVANIGDDANYCGHPFSQANWYCFGRLAWQPSLTAEEIADEWIAQTFTSDKAFAEPVKNIMMQSREACVDYMMPLGLHHIFMADHHYGPEPQGFYPSYPIEWCPVYYHKADAQGIGFDRSPSGTNAVSQYREPFASLYGNIETCPEEFLLWFHHVPWNYVMRDGKTLWQSINDHYNTGVSAVESFQETWSGLSSYVDAERYDHVSRLLKTQAENARKWRDTCLGYFSDVKNGVKK